MSGEAIGYLLGFCMAVGLIWLLVGTLNYLVVRRRMSYRRAITRPWVLGVGALVFVLALLGQVAQRI